MNPLLGLSRAASALRASRPLTLHQARVDIVRHVAVASRDAAVTGDEGSADDRAEKGGEIACR
jgi:hypothetical protein